MYNITWLGFNTVGLSAVSAPAVAAITDGLKHEVP